jgi:hypothetical protein
VPVIVKMIIGVAIRDLHDDIAVQMMLVAAVWVIKRLVADVGLTSYLPNSTGTPATLN